MSRGKVEVGTNIWYCKNPPIGAARLTRPYKRKSGKTGSLKLPRIGSLTPGASSVGLSWRNSALRSQRRKTARKVKLPARKFLGVSKRDRKRTTNDSY